VKKIKIVFVIVVLSVVVISMFLDYRKINATGTAESPELAEVGEEVPNDVETGLIIAPGYMAVKNHCIRCHSAKIITQNRGSRDHWLSIIRWMQSTQNLWPLGEDEAIILDYLENNYAPEIAGRRKPLEGIEWYEYHN